MKIKVYAPPFFNLSAIDEDGFIEVEEGSTLNTLYKKLRIPLPIRPLIIGSVNYERVKLTYKLKDGDVVSILSMLSGG